MARRLMVILMSAMIMIGFVSCDLSDAMKFMSNNIAGPNPGKIDKVDETVDAIWDKEGSNGATQIAPDKDVVIGNITLSKDWISNVSTYLTPFDDESDFSDLAASISSAASTPQGKDSLNSSLAKPLDPEKDKEKIEATQGSAMILKNLLVEAAGKTGNTSIPANPTAENIKDAFNLDEDAGDAEAEEMQRLFEAAIDGVFAISTGKDISKGDMIVLQTLFTVVDVVGEDILVQGEDGIPEFNENIKDMDDLDTDKLLTYANGGVKIVDSISASSKFGDISVSRLLSELISSMQESSEGGEN